MKGYILLSEIRSGSNWFCSMTNSTGKMGNASEWLNSETVDNQLIFANKKFSAQAHFERVIEAATGDNNRFAVKIFPRHLRYTYDKYNYNFLKECLKHHEVYFGVLTRADRLRQAISATRAQQTNYWSSNGKKQSQEYFDIKRICRNIHLLEQSYAFWRSYLAINNIQFQEYKYEDIGTKYPTYLTDIADLLDVTIDADAISTTKVKKQRDQTTEEWVRLFREQADQLDIFNILDEIEVHPRTLKNISRMMRKQPQSKRIIVNAAPGI